MGVGWGVKTQTHLPRELNHHSAILVHGPGPGRAACTYRIQVGGCGQCCPGSGSWAAQASVTVSSSVLASLQSNKVPVVQHPHHVHPLTPLITYSNEHFTPGNPPPHLPADVDPKTGRTHAWAQRRCAGPRTTGGPAAVGGGGALGTWAGGSSGRVPVPLPCVGREPLWGNQSLVSEWISPPLWRSPSSALRSLQSSRYP